MVYHTIMRARLLLDTKTVLEDERIIQRKVWKLPKATPERPSGLKYRLYCGKGGRTIVRYDNESGKADHRHVGPNEIESDYQFVSLSKLLADFIQDVESLSGEIK
ncbi:MAG: hypothetical protein A3F74_14710 [Betaproteobacteria bacterium RIFCSPLOWO2_12_FULL_62_58]|nr:MAG: hypothetical protein A3F74_14710 [Betaproteobacteria bacterium RIFCSPLOWO2_12_FULL_62_58]